jgi:regulatory protein
LADELLAAALAAIGRKERTEAEMREWLADRDAGPEQSQRVMSYLVENLALDDERFATGYVEDKRRMSGWGNDRIESALYSRGVPPHLISAALSGDGEEGEVGRATRVLLEKGSDLEDDRGRRRALGLLARRGFCAEDAYAAIRRAAEYRRDSPSTPARTLGGDQGVQ